MASGHARLAGRKILVVGAGTRASPEPDPPVGNGRAIALLCAREGAAVACADVDEKSAHKTLSRIEKEDDHDCVITDDMTDAETCKRPQRQQSPITQVRGD